MFGDARKKIFGRGGPSYPWGGTENFLDGGGTGLDEGGGDSPFIGYGPPPIPPMLGTPGLVHRIMKI